MQRAMARAPELATACCSVLAALGVAAGCLPGTAAASQLIDRDASRPTLQVSRAGEALLTYRARGRVRHVLAWGAVDAIQPSETRPQTAFRLDYTGGWGRSRQAEWTTFRNACLPYDGPALEWLVIACRAPDGSYWAVQSWQRGLANYGGSRAAWELRLSHWTGDLPKLDVHFGWTYRRYQQLYGTYTYRGDPVYGFRSTAGGAPLDTFGRNIYVDTFDSAYGAGWRRENSFLAHTGTGSFCYGFYPHGARPGGQGSRYRATAIGPGVTPDVSWEGSAPAAYDAAFDTSADADMAARLQGDQLCKPR